jgi:hypothetical protein
MIHKLLGRRRKRLVWIIFVLFITGMLWMEFADNTGYFAGNEAAKLLPNGFLRRLDHECNPNWSDEFSRTSCTSLVEKHSRATPNHPYRETPTEVTPRANDYLSTLNVKIQDKQELEWIMYVSACSVHSNRLAQVLDDSGIPFTFLGIGHRWRRHWGMRMRVYHDYLKTIPADRLVVISDADDVLFVPGYKPSELIRAFKSLVASRDGPLVFFPAELACYPNGDWALNYTAPENVVGGLRRTSPFKYLNAGILIGQAGHVASMMELSYFGDCTDDQLHYTQSFLDPLVWWKDMFGRVKYGSTKHGNVPRYGKPLVGLDHWNQVLAALYGVTISDLKFDHRSQKLLITETSHAPYIIHQNGDKVYSSVLEEIARELGVDYSESRIEDVKSAHEKRIKDEVEEVVKE